VNGESTANSLLFWASGLIGLMDIATALLIALRHRSDVVGWMSFGIVSGTIIGVFIGSARLRKTLPTLREHLEETVFLRLTSSIYIFPTVAFVAIGAGMRFAS
jgi:hypothetical protein